MKRRGLEWKLGFSFLISNKVDQPIFARCTSIFILRTPTIITCTLVFTSSTTICYVMFPPFFSSCTPILLTRTSMSYCCWACFIFFVAPLKLIHTPHVLFWALLLTNTTALPWLLLASSCLLTPLPLHVLLSLLGLFYILLIALSFLLYTPNLLHAPPTLFTHHHIFVLHFYSP